MAFGGGVLLLAVIVVVVLAQTAQRRTGYNSVPIERTLGPVPGGATACQPHELVPAGTGAIRLWVSNPGRTRIVGSVDVLEPGGRVRGGVVASRGSELATFPLNRRLRSDATATVCFHNLGGPVTLLGAPTDEAHRTFIAAAHGRQKRLKSRPRIDYLTGPGPAPLRDVLPMLPERFAAATGSAMAPWLVLVGILGTFAGSIVLLRSPRGRSRRREVLIVFITALGAGTFWASITPALQKTDEIAHFAYVQAFAELGHPPTQLVNTGTLSPQFQCWYDGLQGGSYLFRQTERPPWSTTNTRRLKRSCDHLSPVYDGAEYQAPQPPLYYGLGALAYRIGSGLPLPSRLLLVRLASALIGAVLVVLSYLLVRELVPRSRWAPRIGALAVALQPVVMFNLSGVNPDGLFSVATVAVLLLAARAWRRGLSWPAALGMGLLAGVGLLSKVNFLTVLPSLALVGIAVWWGTSPSGRRRRALQLAAGAAITPALFGVYALVNAKVWHRGGTVATIHSNGSVVRLLTFIWEFFLPRLPGMHNWLGDSAPPPIWKDFIRGIAGRLGWWDDYGIAGYWIPVVLVCALGVVILAGRYLWPRVRRRPWPAAVAAIAALLFLASLVYADYQLTLSGPEGMEPRYLLPVVPLWAGLAGAAVAGVRPSRRPYVVGLLATLFLAHTVIAVGASLQRWYL